MKKNWFWILMVAIGFASCEPPVIFNTPPPQGIAATNAFAPNFQGAFLCESDSSIVVVEEKAIYNVDWKKPFQHQ